MFTPKIKTDMAGQTRAQGIAAGSFQIIC